jgi:hypothetical protein
MTIRAAIYVRLHKVRGINFKRNCVKRVREYLFLLYDTLNHEDENIKLSGLSLGLNRT